MSMIFPPHSGWRSPRSSSDATSTDTGIPFMSSGSKAGKYSPSNRNSLFGDGVFAQMISAFLSMYSSARLSASAEPRVSPSGRLWQMRTKLSFSRKNSAISSRVMLFCGIILRPPGCRHRRHRSRQALFRPSLSAPRRARRASSKYPG